jgi:hypothetical protein
VKLSFINEADVSRRSFLKFLGSAAGAAMGSPLEKIGEFMPKSGRVISISGGSTKFSPFSPTPFSQFVDYAAKNLKLLSKLVPGVQIKMPNDVTDSAYLSFNTIADYDDIDDILSRAKALGGKITSSSGVSGPHEFWTIELPGEQAFLIRDFSKFPKTFISKAVEQYTNRDRPVADIVKDLWEYYPPEETAKHELFQLDQKGVEYLKSRGYKHDELKQEFEISKRTQKERIEHYKRRRAEQEAKDSVEEIKPGDAHLEREVGYERQNISSRPAQALGPFESRLRTALTKI